jgi:hypothetical protein
MDDQSIATASDIGNINALFVVNDVVEVMPRMWPGINKPGGVAKVLKVHYVEGESLFLDWKTAGYLFNSQTKTNSFMMSSIWLILVGNRKFQNSIFVYMKLKTVQEEHKDDAGKISPFF